MNRTTAFIAVCFALALAGCAAAPGEDPLALDLTLEPLELAAAPDSGEPGLALGPDGTVYASWIDPLEGGGHALRFASYAPETGAWSAPKTIAEGEGWFVNWADVPSLAVGDDGFLAAHFMAYNGKGKYAYGVRVSRSTDGGETWSEPVWLHDDASPAEHGFVTLVPAGAGTMRAFWLDGRQFAEGKAVMTVRARTLFADGSLGPETLLDDRTCDCCPTTAAPLPNDGMIVFYRNRTEDEIRDIWYVRYDGRAWSEPAPLHEDGWHIAGCPVNGPATDAAGEDVVVAWFTGAGETPRVQAAFSADAGATFGPPIRLDLGHPTGRVDVVRLEDGGAVVSWLEGKGEAHAAGVYARRVRPDGSAGEAVLVQPSSTSRASGYPRMIRSGDDLFFAWTETGETRRVRTAVASLGG